MEIQTTGYMQVLNNENSEAAVATNEVVVDSTLPITEPAKEYSDKEGREGVIRELYERSKTMGEAYEGAIELASKINYKWQKKRLLQIGMFEDLLHCINIAAGFNSALQNHLMVLENRVKKLQEKLGTEKEEAKNETDTTQPVTEEAVTAAA